MPTMIVLVNLKDDVIPQEYERWVMESYAPVVRSFPSVTDWRNHRTSGLLGSEDAPPYQYIVTLEFADMEQLGRDMAGEEMRRLLEELHGLAETVQILAERFA